VIVRVEFAAAAALVVGACGLLVRLEVLETAVTAAGGSDGGPFADPGPQGAPVPAPNAPISPVKSGNVPAPAGASSGRRDPLAGADAAAGGEVADAARRLRARVGAARAVLEGLPSAAAAKVTRAVERQQAAGWEGVWERVAEALVRAWTRELRLAPGQALKLREILDAQKPEARARGPEDPRPLIPLAAVVERFRAELNGDQAARMDEWFGER